MKKIEFNEQWEYGYLDQKNGKAISLPHDAMIYEKRTDNSGGGEHIGWFEGHDYWYEKQFFADETLLNKTVIVEFEGIYHNAEIYCNDEKLIYWPYGYSSIFVDLTGKINPGDNRIKVIARNKQQPNSRWYTGSGIYRPVWMYILPQKHIEHNTIRIETTDYTKGEILISLKTNAPGQIQVEVMDDDTVVISDSVHTEGSLSIVRNIPNTKLWSPDTPNLYTCKVSFLDDEHVVRFGIRSIQCDAQGGFRINGDRVIMRGACVHHDNGLLGACAYEFAERRKVRLIKDAGFNAIRSAHNPCSKAMLDACDEMGILMIDELSDCWYIHKTKYDYACHFAQWWRRDINAMVNKDVNHPSIVMYSIGNEVSETSQKEGIALTRQMTEYLYDLDQSRPVTCGVNIFFNYLFSLGLGVYTDKKADRAAKMNTKPGKKKKPAVGSEYFNKIAGLLGDKTMKIGATLRGSDRKTKDAFSELDVAGYNYGILRYKNDLKRYPNRVILGTETFCKDTYAFWKIAEKNSALIGDFVWSGIDYLGELGLGAQEYSNYADDFTHGVGWISSGCGRLDLTGKELSEADYMKVAYGIDPIHIAVKPADHFGEAHSSSAWRMTNARSSWSWNGCEGKTTQIEVYADAHTVALYLNGKLIKQKPAGKNARTYFKIKYYPGTIKAVAYDIENNEIASSSLTSAGDDTILGMKPEMTKIHENDLAYIRFQYTDKNGILKPLARGRITLEITGGELLAFGHACPYNKDGYHHDFSETYFGEAMAIIKPKAKVINIAAASRFGKCSSSIEVCS